MDKVHVHVIDCNELSSLFLKKERLKKSAPDAKCEGQGREESRLSWFVVHSWRGASHHVLLAVIASGCVHKMVLLLLETISVNRVISMMAAAGDNNVVWYIYRGDKGEIIPDDATHIIVLVKVIPRQTFWKHRNIVEVHCHENVEKIEKWAFYKCPNVRRVVMPGVKVVERWAFEQCEALTYVECGKLERIEQWAFQSCIHLRSINLLSTRIVGEAAFHGCFALVDAKFGGKLERIGARVFGYCTTLERLTIPLKDGIIITEDNAFYGCRKLKEVDLERALHETMAGLLLYEEWRNDLSEEIDSINQILPNASAGKWDCDSNSLESGEKAQAIRRWIKSVHGKIDHYKARHQQVMDVAAATLQLDLPHDIVRSNIFPFLALPSHILDGENHQVEVGGDGDEERVGVDEREGNEVGRGNNLEEDDQDEEREDERDVEEVGRDNYLERDVDVEELGSDHEENKVSPPRIIVMEILLFYWLVVWGSFSLMRVMPFASLCL